MRIINSDTLLIKLLLYKIKKIYLYIKRELKKDIIEY